MGRLPKAVEEAEKVAEELRRQAYPEEEAGKPEEEKTEETAALPTEESEATKEEGTAQPVPEETKPAEEGVDYKAEYERLRASYDVLQGKYNAELPRALQELKDLRAEMDAMKTSAPTGEETSEDEEGKPISPKEHLERMEESYGPEFIQDLKGIILAETKSIKEKVEGLEAETVQSKEDRFMQDLTILVPDWQTIVNDPEFSRFLEMVPPDSNERRLDLAKRAQLSLDARALSQFYIDFKKSREKAAPETPPEDVREELVAPHGSAGTGNISTGENVEFVRASELEDHAQKVNRGYYEHRPDEFRKAEDRINKAIAEGRVIHG